MTADGPALMERLEAELAALRRENQQLLTRIEAVEHEAAGRKRAPRGGESGTGRQVASPGGPTAGDGEPKRIDAGFSRRSLMRRGGVAALAGLGAAAAGGLLVAAPVTATDNTTLAGGTVNTTTQPTAIAVSDDSGGAAVYGFGITDHGLGAFPESAGIAGHGHNAYDDAVLGYHDNGGVGVRGIADEAHGIGVYGTADALDGVGVKGSSDGDSGVGVSGKASVGTGVQGTSGPPSAILIEFGGSGVAGYSSIGPGIVGYSTHQVGVLGFGPLVGGSFVGGDAQINLRAGGRTTHPARGTRGDFYVDKSGRLWFCRTGGKHSVWHQLA